MTTLTIDQDQPWIPWGEKWALNPEITYLNHGSFGPSPLPVRQACRQWQDQLEENPMGFYVRQLEPLLLDVKRKLGHFIGVHENDLALLENSTYGMNVVAYSFPLQEGDEVLLTDHEYGAVEQIWQRKCEQAGATMRQVKLPLPLNSVEEIVSCIEEKITKSTKLFVVSHITSVTAVILPIQKICDALRKRNIAVCVDGPHAIAMLPLDIKQLDCDFYTASCHKWLSASFGSGFLYVHPRQHSIIQPVVKSWGRLLPAEPHSWHEEFTWLGTRDPAALLSISSAIDFLEEVGLENFRRRTHFLARYARQQITNWTQLPPLIPDDEEWYGSMCTLPLPSGKASQQTIDDHRENFRKEFSIEIPFVEWNGQRFIRVSTHLYNNQPQIDTLVTSLKKYLA